MITKDNSSVVNNLFLWLKSFVLNIRNELIKFSEGFKEAALKFQQEAGLQEPALCSSLDERIMIREAVQNGRIPEAISMVNALHPELLDNDRYLYFHLQVSTTIVTIYLSVYHIQ